MDKTIHTAEVWFEQKGWQAHDFQKECWRHYLEGRSGLLNAPTGSGKTLALFWGVLLNFMAKEKPKGLFCLWISPIKALSKEIVLATSAVCEQVCAEFTIASRTGDTEANEKTKQKKHAPHLLVTTPESLHLLLSHSDASKFFKNLDAVVVDEWHELIGTKRGVQMELALSRLKGICPQLKAWGISATIGNLDEAKNVLLGNNPSQTVMVKAEIEKKIEVATLFPDKVEQMPWAGHLGVNMLPKVLELIQQSVSTLVFTNTRAQAEIWYFKILEAAPELAGAIALHHGSLEAETRAWVEEALHKKMLKAVVCTSSLDLGVDFRPVDTVVQIGSPKGVARFLQRAGRSGHRPGEVSRIYFVPTHSLELVEGSAIKKAILAKRMESKPPFMNSFDVLLQYLTTLAVGEGLKPETIKKEVLSTHCFQFMADWQWDWCLKFLTHGGGTLEAYDDFNKLVWDDESESLKIANRRLSMRHRLSIGTIVSDSNMQVVYMSGKRIGTIEEWFVARLKPGDVFWFSGKALELVMVKEMKAFVKNSPSQKGVIPSWMGGRMPLSSELSDMIRNSLNDYLDGQALDPELESLFPIFELQQQRSIIPHKDELLVEFLESKEGYHLFFFPFEGRFVHEAIASLIAVRVGKHLPITFSIAMNDYGFELLTDVQIKPEELLELDLFTPNGLEEDILASTNSTEMAKRRFREIAAISGLVFNGFPGKTVSTKHTQANSQLFFKVFEEYEPDNLLFRQAFDEVLMFHYEMGRMKETFERISRQKIVLRTCGKPTPFAFPIMVDRLRMKFSNEDIASRVERMLKQYE